MSIRLTPEQLSIDPTQYVLEFCPGDDPGRPSFVDVGEVTLEGVAPSLIQASGIAGLVAFSFPGRCLTRDREAEGGTVERYAARPGYFVVVVNGEGEQVYAEHTGAGALYPRRHEDVRTADDVDASLEADERLPDASGALK